MSHMLLLCEALLTRLGSAMRHHMPRSYPWAVRIGIINHRVIRHVRPGTYSPADALTRLSAAPTTPLRAFTTPRDGGFATFLLAA